MLLTDIFYSILLLAVPLWFLFNASRKRLHFIQVVEKLPGPPALPLVGSSLQVIRCPRNELFKLFDQIAKTYWPIFKTWDGTRAEIHLCKPEHAEIILNSTIHINKSSFYDFLKPWLGEGLLTSSGRKWHSHRKLLTPAFHFKILENFQEVFAEKSQLLIKKLKKEVENKNGFDIYPYITLCTLDIICETAMGTAINAQENSNSDYVSAIYEVSELILHRMFTPWLYPDFMYWLSSRGRKFKKDVQILHNFTKKVIEERKQDLLKKSTVNDKSDEQDTLIGKKKRLAFLDLLLQASEFGRNLTDEEIREEVDTFMFEGHDTTSAAIGWTLFLLGNYQDIQERVYNELNEIFQGSDRPATTRDIQEMKYLEMVIKESLRLYPSVPFIARYATEDIQIDDYTIPTGCEITVHIYHVLRNPDHYSNPDEFNPDNFLPDVVQRRHPYAYIPFSAGSRNCIGQKFAMMEEKTIISSILRNYKITSLEKPENITLLSELVLRPQNGIQIILQSRHGE